MTTSKFKNRKGPAKRESKNNVKVEPVLDDDSVSCVVFGS